MIKKYKSLILLSFCLMFTASLSAADTTDYLSLMKSTDSVVRMRAAQGAGNKKIKEAVPELINLLKDKSQGVIINAIVSLGALRDASAIEPLIETVEKSTYTAVKIMGVQTLGYFHDKRIIVLLNKMADDKNPAIRSAACRSLGKVGDEKDVDKLIEKVEKDDDALVRKVAIGALGEIAEIKNADKKRDAIEKAMEQATKDKNLKTKKSAEKALKRLKKLKRKK